MDTNVTFDGSIMDMKLISTKDKELLNVPSSEDCLLFSFVLDSNIIGILCLIGFLGNILSFIVLWQEKHDLSIMFILEALVMADLTVIWMIFLQDVIPGLAYVVPVLRECKSACHKISQITRPLLWISQGCVLWLTASASLNQYMSTCYSSKANKICNLESARKQVASIIVFSVFIALPLTFDTTFELDQEFKNETIKLVDLKSYQYIYINGIIFSLFLLIPISAIVVISIKSIQNFNTYLKKRNEPSNICKGNYSDIFQVIVTLCITIFICYIPSCIKCILQWTVTDFREDCGFLNFYLDSFCKLFQALNSAMKIFIFSLFSQHFYETLKGTICLKKRWHQDVTKKETYKDPDHTDTALISPLEP